MSTKKIIALLLIVAGITGLVYGKFAYTKETHKGSVGSIEMSIQEKRTVNVPLWAGVGLLLAGGGLLFIPGRKS